MENWQKYYIGKKIQELLKTTICSPILLANLKAESLLTEEECQNLERANDRKGKYEFGKKLYRILETREKAYETLIYVFENKGIKLTRAAEILRDGYNWKENFDPNFSFEDHLKGIKYNVQNPVAGFVGRDEEVELLKSMLLRPIIIARQYAVISQVNTVTGLGGIGKTELCRKFIKACAHLYEDIIWLDADNEDGLLQAFYELADDKYINTGSKTSTGGNKVTTVLLSEVYAVLAQRKCLLVFDNADNRDVVSNFLPTKYVNLNLVKISVILTSRYTDWDNNLFSVIELEGLKWDDAVEFVNDALFKFHPEQEHSMSEVYKLVDLLSNKGRCFPLALQQAVAYIKYKLSFDSEYTVTMYIDEFEEMEKSKMLSFRANPETNPYTRTTRTTWNISIKSIKKDSTCGQTAIKILQIASLISPDRIKREIFFKLSDEQNLVKAAVNLLVSYSMMSTEAEGQAILSIHRLVQDVTILDFNTGTDCANQILIDTLILLNTEFRSKNLRHVTSAWKHASQIASVVRECYFKSVYTSRLTPLHLLCNQNYGNNTKSVQALVRAIRWSYRSKSVNAKDDLGRTPMWWAASSGNAAAIKILIRENASPKKSGRKNEHYHLQVEEMYGPTFLGYTEFHIAARNGHTECVKLLLQHFPVIKNIKNYEGETPAFVAAKYGSVEIAKILEPEAPIKLLELMNYFFDKDKFNEFKSGFQQLSDQEKKLLHGLGLSLDNALHAAINMRYEVELIKFLVQSGARVDQFRMHTPLHEAAKEGDLEVIEYLVQNGAHPTTPNATGYTPLHVACQRGKLEVVKWMCASEEVDINVTDDKGDTPLHTAAFHGWREVVVYLLEVGANVNCSDRLGVTPVISAATAGFFDIVRAFLDFKDDIIINMTYVPNNEGKLCHELGLTLLHAAAAYGQLELVQKLVETRNNTGALDESCFSPLLLAVVFKQTSVAEYFIENCKSSVTAEVNFEKLLNGLTIILKDPTFPFSSKNAITMLVSLLKRVNGLLSHGLRINPGTVSQLEQICDGKVRQLFQEKCTDFEIGNPGFILRKLVSFKIIESRLKFLQELLKARKDNDANVLFDYDSLTFFSSFIDVKPSN